MSLRVSRAVVALLACVMLACAGANSSRGDSSESNSDSSGQSSDSESSGESTASSEGDSAAEGVGSTADSTRQSIASEHPTSQESSETSRPSSDTSRTSTDSSEQSSDQTTENSSQSQSESNVAPVFTTAGLVSTAGLIGVLIWMGTRPDPQVEKAAQAWLRANHHQLQEDLAMGAGPALRDLAALARVRTGHLRRFGWLLHQHREELLGLADTTALTPRRAGRMFQRLGELMGADQVLRADGQAFVAGWEAARR